MAAALVCTVTMCDRRTESSAASRIARSESAVAFFAIATPRCAHHADSRAAVTAFRRASSALCWILAIESRVAADMGGTLIEECEDVLVFEACEPPCDEAVGFGAAAADVAAVFGAAPGFGAAVFAVFS